MTNSELEPYPWEVNSFFARQAIRDGRSRDLAAYLHDAAKATKLLGDLSDPPNGAPAKLSLLSGGGDPDKREDLLKIPMALDVNWNRQ